MPNISLKNTPLKNTPLKNTLYTHAHNRPITTAFLGVMVFSGVSLMAGLMGQNYGFNAMETSAVMQGVLLCAMVWGAWAWGVLPLVSHTCFTMRGGVYGALWLVPVVGAVVLDPTRLYTHNFGDMVQGAVLSLGQEWFYRGVIFVFLVGVFARRSLPATYVVLMVAVVSAMGHMYTLFTPAPMVYILYQIIWTVLYGMVAGYAMVLLGNIWLVGLLHAITILYAGFEQPVFGVPALYVSLLWFCIMALVGRMLIRQTDIHKFLREKL